MHTSSTRRTNRHVTIAENKLRLLTAKNKRLMAKNRRLVTNNQELVTELQQRQNEINHLTERNRRINEMRIHNSKDICDLRRERDMLREKTTVIEKSGDCNAQLATNMMLIDAQWRLNNSIGELKKALCHEQETTRKLRAKLHEVGHGEVVNV